MKSEFSNQRTVESTCDSAFCSILLPPLAFGVRLPHPTTCSQLACLPHLSCRALRKAAEGRKVAAEKDGGGDKWKHDRFGHEDEEHDEEERVSMGDRISLDGIPRLA